MAITEPTLADIFGLTVRTSTGRSKRIDSAVVNYGIISGRRRVVIKLAKRVDMGTSFIIEVETIELVLSEDELDGIVTVQTNPGVNLLENPCIFSTVLVVSDLLVRSDVFTRGLLRMQKT